MENMLTTTLCSWERAVEFSFLTPFKLYGGQKWKFYFSLPAAESRRQNILNQKLHNFVLGSVVWNAIAAELQARKVAADPMVLPSFITSYSVLVLGASG